jgi:plasmid replication initiation protein
MKELSLLSDARVDAFKNKIVMQHNTITSGRYDFTACQMDIVFMLLASLRPDELNYRIHASEIELITGRKWNYAQLRKATEDIGSRMFEIDIEKEDGKKIYRQMWLFQKIDYIEGEGAFEVMISEPARPYFFELKNTFTKFQLKSVLGCSSKYAKRLYTLACQWRSLGRSRPMEIIDLKKMLGLVDKKGNEQYEKISAFTKYVLEIAKEQINQNTDIEFDYKLYKVGRSYKKIEFFINISPVIQTQIDFNKPVAQQVDIKNIMSYGLTEEQATIIAESVDMDDFKKLIKELNEKVKRGDIKINNTAAYVVGVYKNKNILR